MRTPKFVAVAILTLGLLTAAAAAHFQELIPSDDIVEPGESRKVDLDIIFTHPMENGPAMEMAKPKQFGVMVGGEKQDLMESLKAVKVQEKTAYKAAYEIKRPGDYIFYIEPAPYWEPAEGKMIIHYTKVIVDAFGAGEGWDEMVGFPVEIEPLVRPYGLWTGNTFKGIARRDGKVVPFAEVEVEYRNVDGKVKAPTDAHVTQVVKADANGVFSYTMPRAGWWSFAVLVEGKDTMTNPDGEQVPVEQGALIWVKTVDMK